jgi:hypothetical protein
MMVASASPFGRAAGSKKMLTFAAIGFATPTWPLLDFARNMIMRARSGRVVLTPRASQPYEVVLECEGDRRENHPVATIREGEALIRSRVPPPPVAKIMKVRTPHGIV